MSEQLERCSVDTPETTQREDPTQDASIQSNGGAQTLQRQWIFFIGFYTKSIRRAFW